MRCFGALSAVPHQLFKGLEQRIRITLIQIFGFVDRQWHSVNEQNNVWNDAGLHTARCVDAELVDSQKMVIEWIFEIDEANIGGLFPSQFVFIGLRAIEQLLNGFVDLNQISGGAIGDFLKEFFQLFVGQSSLSVICLIDSANILEEYVFEEDFAERRSQTGFGGGGVRLPLINDLPAQLTQLVKERFFYEQIFRHGGVSR